MCKNNNPDSDETRMTAAARMTRIPGLGSEWGSGRLRLKGNGNTYVQMSLGDRILHASSQTEGVIRFVGSLQGVKGEWAGIELDEPVGK